MQTFFVFYPVAIYSWTSRIAVYTHSLFITQSRKIFEMNVDQFVPSYHQHELHHATM